MRTSEIPGKTRRELMPASPPVIQMDSSDPVFLSAEHLFCAQLLKNLSVRITRLSPVLPLDKPYNRFIKRSMDVLISLLVISLVLSWLLPLLALLIKTDSRGPVFFIQKRNGRNGEVFRCVKLRTMVVNPDADMVPASGEDKRITRLGKLLRNYYLDELPQFFNVLLGQMSVAGPRPHMLSDNRRYETLIEHYRFREKVKPGITGLAQILGYTGYTQDPSKMAARVQLDILYIRHWSLLTEIKILFRTFSRVTGIG